MCNQIAEAAVSVPMKKLLIALAAVLPAWGTAEAQDNQDYRVRVGLGAQFVPEFVGSKSDNLAPMFHVNIAHGANEFNFGAPDDSPGVALVSSNGFTAGPAGNIQWKRKESEVGAPVGNVSTTFEVGAFAQYEAKDSFRVRGEVLKGLNGHDGVLGSVGADKIWRDGDRYVFSIGPRVLFSDGRFQRAYFGVSPAAALASGLPVYVPKSGIYAVAVASGLNYQLNRRWGLFGFARYERLVGDAARSPIVGDLGSRNQFSGGFGLNYIFTVHRSR